MASTNKTTAKANLTISFATRCDVSDSINVELDADLNEDKSCFLYGDTAYFRVYTNPLDMEYDMYISDPSASLFVYWPPGHSLTVLPTEDKEETLEFVEEETASLEKPTEALDSTLWYGNNLGVLILSGNQEVRVSNKVNDMYFGTCKITYKAPYKVYGLILYTKAETEWPVIVYIKQKETT
jgi:hypothetical protein